MFATAPAGNGGRSRCRPAALSLRTDRCVPAFASASACVAAAAAALCAALLMTGLAMPLVEWFALPERVEEMKHRPREFVPHFVSVLLALCGLDLINDLAGAALKPVARTTGRTLYIVAVKAVMLHALLGLAMGASVPDPEHGDAKSGLVSLVTSEYAGQWGEVAVAVVGNVLLLSATHAPVTGPVLIQSGSVGDIVCAGAEDKSGSRPSSDPIGEGRAVLLDC